MSEIDLANRKTSTISYAAIITFIFVLVVFAAINLWTMVSVPACCDQIDPIGFPFRFFESGGIAGTTTLFIASLIADIVIAIAAAAGLAWVVQRASKTS